MPLFEEEFGKRWFEVRSDLGEGIKASILFDDVQNPIRQILEARVDDLASKSRISSFAIKRVD